MLIKIYLRCFLKDSNSLTFLGFWQKGRTRIEQYKIQLDQAYEQETQIFQQAINHLKISQDPIEKSRSFFLFINSSSGGGVGSSMLQLQAQEIKFILPKPNTQNQEFQANVYFYNLRKKKEVGFNKLKEKIQIDKQKPIVVICGGDGTVMWIVHELANHNIDPSKLSLAVIPLGTGNDFSRYLGWGPQQKTLTENNFQQLKKLIFLWSTAKEQLFDLWDVEAQATQKGYFEKVQNQKDVKLEGKYLYKTFCNYFSFGIDGQIGYSFDKCRTKSRAGNLMMYGALGMKETMSNPPALNQVISCLKTIQILETNKRFLPCSEINQLMKKGKLIMATDSHPHHSQKKLQTSFFNILALNINSYMGGTKQIWNNSGSGVYSSQEEMNFSKQRSDDEKIQIVAFKSGAGLAVEKIIPGNAEKIAQGKGPYLFDFYQYPLKQQHRTFLQIDGQFIRFTHPKRIVIKHSLLVPGGKIRVLKTDKLQIPSPLKIKLQWKLPFKI